MKKLLSCIFAAVFIVSFTAQAARVDTLAVSTAYLPSPDNVLVIVPDKADVTPVPVLYLLHGFTGNQLDWTTLTRPDLPALADENGMIIVMPDGMDSWYWDSPVDTTMNMESFFVNDLVKYIDTNYNTIPEASKRAITGLSMGGHGALWLAMRHPDVWANAGSMSGGVDIRPFPESWKMKTWLGDEENNPGVWENHTVINLVPSLKPGMLNITFDCGVDDFFYDVNNNLHQALVEAGIPHDYTSRPGGHSHRYWANSILYHLLFFKENFNK